MKFKLEIEMDNAAFENGEHEVARILRETAARLLSHSFDDRNYRLRDHNGNDVGRWEVVNLDRAEG